MDIDIGEGVLAYSEKHFGTFVTETIVAFLLAAIACGAIVYIIKNVVIPVYKLAESLFQSGHLERFKKPDILASLLALLAGVISSLAISAALTYPARIELNSTDAETKALKAQLIEIKTELKQTTTNLQDAQTELETYRNQLDKSKQALQDMQSESQPPVKESPASPH
jgi:hypothetical protein